MNQPGHINYKNAPFSLEFYNGCSSIDYMEGSAMIVPEYSDLSAIGARGAGPATKVCTDWYRR